MSYAAQWMAANASMIVSKIGLFAANTGNTGTLGMQDKLNIINNVRASQSAREASYFQVHTVAEDVLKLDTSSRPNGAVFWSGKGHQSLATKHAVKTGKTVLEHTPAGQYLESLNLFDNYPGHQAIHPWQMASGKFAAEASGQVSAFTRGSRPTSIFRTVEVQALRSNPSVTGIKFYPK